MIRIILNVLLSLALISSGVWMVLAGMHAIPGSEGASLVSREALSAPDLVVTASTASAELTGYGSDKDVYARGGTATGFIEVKNTGSTAINDVTVDASISRSVPVLGTMTVGSKGYTFSSLNIKPGETKKIEFSFDIPKEVSGFSTAGSYKISGSAKVGGNNIGSFEKTIKVT